MTRSVAAVLNTPQLSRANDRSRDDIGAAATTTRRAQP
ncbi:hypothetical protein APY04_3067 [Hyphomicrobium sulfonivorans]|uniref:Uncharacterized protein n=1 Tax=Hyphomicrobium sulfonivorans TaxID=121290 RepID=A0A125NTY8_HYPSL|nr:hypothetical protein APY04_3067 [Hyphomicrobium sulfonivorans]